MTGPELAARRKAAGVKSTDLAAKMGLGRTRIPQIEAQAAPSPTIVAKYLDAVRELYAKARVDTDATPTPIEPPRAVSDGQGAA